MLHRNLLQGYQLEKEVSSICDGSGFCVLPSGWAVGSKEARERTKTIVDELLKI